MNLFEELDIEDHLQWKVRIAFKELPGEFTTFDFIKGIPAPFNFALAILLNDKMLTLQEKIQCIPALLAMLIEGQYDYAIILLNFSGPPEKIQCIPALLPMLIEGQEFIDKQDELSCLTFMRKYGMPERINTEVFISMAK
eukprot:1195159-Prorocentrum_minimum.AAC.1